MLKKIGEKILRKRIINDEFFDEIHKNKMPMDELMTYYRCAIMEVETKFKVLDEEFSLQYDRNPIESIKTRLKSLEGIPKEIGGDFSCHGCTSKFTKKDVKKISNIKGEIEC